MLWKFLKRYDDDRIRLCIEHALEKEQILNKAKVAVSSKEGIVAIDGRTDSRLIKRQVGEIVKSSLAVSGVRFNRVVDNVILA